MDYVISLAVFATIYAIAALSFNLLIGHAGIFSVAHAAFIGIGAYATGILTSRLTGLFPLAIVLGALVAAGVGWVFARATLRVSGDYMVVASFALLVIFAQIFTNWTGVTGGGAGLASIPRPGFVDGDLLGNNVLFGLLCVLVAALMYFVSHRIVYSPLGRVLRALRENEDAAASLGKFVRRFRGVVFAVSSAMAAVAGSLYAHFMSYVSPLDFTVHLTVLVLTMVIVAGTGRLWAVPVAAALVMGITDGVRYVDLPQQIAPGAQQILYGLLLVLFAVFRPEGLLGRKRERASRPAAISDVPAQSLEAQDGGAT
jgi:ABC-type branched-subunit amino acid transport system permease subunit